MQTKRMSVVEVLCSTAFGYVIAVTTQIIVYPWYGIHTTVGQNVGLGVIFTVVSVVRSYFFRRIFNKLTERSR